MTLAEIADDERIGLEKRLAAIFRRRMAAVKDEQELIDLVVECEAAIDSLDKES